LLPPEFVASYPLSRPNWAGMEVAGRREILADQVRSHGFLGDGGERAVPLDERAVGLVGANEVAEGQIAHG